MPPAPEPVVVRIGGVEFRARITDGHVIARFAVGGILPAKNPVTLVPAAARNIDLLLISALSTQLVPSLLPPPEDVKSSSAEALLSAADLLSFYAAMKGWSVLNRLD